MPENVPSGRSETPGAQLRSWGHDHATLKALQTLLPGYPAERQAGLAPGLYVDHLRTPWVAVRGEIRVSLARIISVTPEGKHQLVGQVQVTAAESDILSSMTLRYYIHQPAGVIAREVVEEAEWWLHVIDAHYRMGGSPVVTADHGVSA